MSELPTHPFSLTQSLAQSATRLSDVCTALSQHRRVDVSGLPAGALSLLLHRAQRSDGGPMLVIAPDNETAAHLAADLRFWSGDGTAASVERDAVLLYPASDTTPFVEVATDRRAAMDRLSVLFHLAQGLPCSFLVTSAAGLARKVPPRASVQKRSLCVKAESELNRETLIATLVEGGYLRVPVVEDPGSFAVRGALLDVFCPHAERPARIELDGDLVFAIHSFDTEDQRTRDALSELWIHPAREAMLGSEELTRARDALSDLCDEHEIPTSKRRQLVDEVVSGRSVLGIDGYLPAFYPRLDSLLDYLPQAITCAVIDPTAGAATLDAELDQAMRDRAARLASKSPAFAISSHYVNEEDLLTRVQQGRLLVCHKLAMAGTPGDDEAEGLSRLDAIDSERVLSISADDLVGLRAELKASRSTQGAQQPLSPLVNRVQAWLGDGLRVLLAARTSTQAERLIDLLQGYKLPIARDAKPFEPTLLDAKSDGRAQVVIGRLADGFVLPAEALACVTEEEIFGARGHRRARAKPKDKKRAFLEDLRELSIGDYVVHIDHGIGRYLGLERKTVPLSRYEEMQGMKPVSVEVLVVEYSDHDKLFLPVTRLNQIEKLGGGDISKVKLDKLGGQTFARTKARVRGEVKKLADDLLALYASRATRERPPIQTVGAMEREFEAAFPFEETPDQARAIEEVLGDLSRAMPMDRLVCGDVGFGKTEVALRAAFRVAMSGRQVAVLCPTTVLAQQHYMTFKERLRDYPMRVEVLSRFVGKQEQTGIVGAIKAGQVDIVVGTHRLLSKDIHFPKLGLLVVDEEQRFGVAHKERIKKLREEVDVLTLSATPIPRTLQLAIGGMRDLSLITTPPVDRRAIRTIVTRWDDHILREAIRRELSRGGQAFLIYNRIEGLYERAARLQELVPEARIATAHGRLKEATLEQVMTDFVEGRYDVLCATAIVENGLDIPRANTILIDRADTFGLSQLYQLRGRVGRSRERAYCYLIAPPPSQMTDEARTRIEALERFTQLGSGFQVASLDMELRGAGDLLGAEQHGTVAAVGFELFVRMLEEAVAELRGHHIEPTIDPEVNLDIVHHIPDDYISDVGVRLSFYKRLASAEDEISVSELGAEMEDRFGPAPEPARQLVRVMALKPLLRSLRILGCEASGNRVTLHFTNDAPLDPQKLTLLVSRSPNWQLTPDLRLTRRYAADEREDAIDRVRQLLAELPLQP